MGYVFAHHRRFAHRLRKRTEIFKSFLRVLSALRGEDSWQANQLDIPKIKRLCCDPESSHDE